MGSDAETRVTVFTFIHGVYRSFRHSQLNDGRAEGL